MAGRKREDIAREMFLDGASLSQIAGRTRASLEDILRWLNSIGVDQAYDLIYPIVLSACVESAKSFEECAKPSKLPSSAKRYEARLKDRAAAAKYSRENLAGALDLLRQIDGARKQRRPPRPVARLRFRAKAPKAEP